MSSEVGYRETDEWRALETAISNLNRWGEEEGSESMVVDFTLVVYRVPEEQNSEVIGGYSHYATSAMPHINQGLVEQAAGYWSDYGQTCNCGECDE